MTTRLATTPPERVAADLLVLPIADGDAARSGPVRELDRRLGGRLLRETRRSGFRGRSGQELVYQTHGAARPAVIVPRTAPRREQLIRAEALSNRGLVRMIHPDELTPARLSQELEKLLERPVAAATQVRLDAAAATAAELDSLLAQRPG